MAGHPTCHVNVIKFKWEIKWTGGLPHLPGVLHLRVKGPLYPRDGHAFEDYLNKRKRLLRHETS